MVDYCHTEGCLQTSILNYFGELNTDDCTRCDNCTDTRERIDVTVDAQKVLSCVIRMGQRFGKVLVAQVLTGSNSKKVKDFGFQKLSTYGILADKSQQDINLFIEFLISEDYLAVEQGSFPTVRVALKGKSVLQGKAQVFRKQQVETRQIVGNNPLFEDLRQWRKEVAQMENVPPFVIFSDQVLRDICVSLPRTLEELLTVRGIGEQKKVRYGTCLLDVIAKYDREDVPLTKDVVAVEKAPNKLSHHATLELHEQGKTIEEIALMRGLSIATITGHLIRCSQEGIVSLQNYIPNEFRGILQDVVSNYGNEGLKFMKEHLPEEVSYFVLKAFLVERQKTGSGDDFE